MLALLLSFVIVGGVVFAVGAIPDPDTGEIYACYMTHRNDSEPQGQVRIVSTAAECRDNETPISWNQVGPAGPQGLPGPAGPQGEPGPAGLNCWDLNGNGVSDLDEDTNGDGVIDVWDCRGVPQPMPTATPTPPAPVGNDGSSPGNAALSCGAIHTAYPSLPSGYYWIDPDGPGGQSPSLVYCDMITSGGG